MNKRTFVGFVGDSLVGKSSIIQRRIQNSFPSNLSSTIGTNSFPITIKNSDLMIFDTAGQEKYAKVVNIFLRSCEIIIVVFDISSRTSFNSLNKWLNIVQDVADKDYKLIFVGNKVDLSQKREVMYEEGSNFAKAHDSLFYEISALTGEGVNALFDSVADISQETMPVIPTNYIDITDSTNAGYGCC